MSSRYRICLPERSEGSSGDLSLLGSNLQGFFTPFGRSHRPGVLRENDIIIMDMHPVEAALFGLCPWHCVEVQL